MLKHVEFPLLLYTIFIKANQRKRNIDIINTLYFVTGRIRLGQTHQLHNAGNFSQKHIS